MIRVTGGKVVTVGGVDTYGHRDEAEEPALGNDGAAVFVTMDVVRVATGILPQLSYGEPITVDGENLVIGSHRRIEDGDVTEIELQEG